MKLGIATAFFWQEWSYVEHETNSEEGRVKGIPEKYDLNAS